jgi:hypothetical protein
VGPYTARLTMLYVLLVRMSPRNMARPPFPMRAPRVRTSHPDILPFTFHLVRGFFGLRLQMLR